MDKETYENILHSSVRGFIISALAKGFQESHPQSNVSQKRHALSANEIGIILKKDYNTDVKKANLYFHLQKLEDSNLIQIIDTTRQGKRFTSYYGRTAKIYISEDDIKRSTYNILGTNNFKQLIISLNDNQLPNNCETTINILKTLNPPEMKIFENWYTENGFNLIDLDLELYEFHKLFSVLYRFTPQIGRALQELKQTLYFHQKMLDSSNEIFHRKESDEIETIILSEDDIMNYWKTVPIIKIFPNQAYTKILGDKQIIDKGTIMRSSIVNMLKLGLESQETGKLRHALTAKEILDRMNDPIYQEIIDLQTSLKEITFNRNMEREAIEIQIGLLGSEVLKKSNLYFHLQKLEKANFVKEVGFIKYGKRHITYYGTTAKLFSPMIFTNLPSYNILEEPDLIELIKRINPNYRIKEIQVIINDLKSLNKYRIELFQMWTQMFDDALSDLEFDYSELSKLLMLTIRYTPEIIETISKLAQLLKIR
ncbi:MAG: hypothetical protein HeimC2_00640 [Candidatus Heimdallarchaeota archaeon LC_2]|nr:MAG: hypothetical protein HeimC2_00640 [Candidatus Heimdallarchaeota archaeon LC_2]